MKKITVPKSVQALSPIERASHVLKFEERKAELTTLAEDSKRIVEIRDPVGYDECHAARMRLKNTRVAIEKTGKDARSDATAFSKAVIAREDELVAIISPEEKRLQGLQDAHDAIAQAEKDRKREAEEARIRAENAALDAIRNLPLAMVGKSAAEILDATAALQNRFFDQEFNAAVLDRAIELRRQVVDKLMELHDGAEKAEATAAALEAERAKNARDRAAQAEREAADRKAASDAEEARKTAERAAALEREHIADIQRIPLNLIGASVTTLELEITDAETLQPGAVIRDPERLQLAIQAKAETVAKLQQMRDQAVQAEADRKAQAERDRAAADEARQAQEATRQAAHDARMAELRATAPPLPMAAIDALAQLVANDLGNDDTAIRLRFAIERDRDIVARLIREHDLELAEHGYKTGDAGHARIDFARAYIATGETAQA